MSDSVATVQFSDSTLMELPRRALTGALSVNIGNYSASRSLGLSATLADPLSRGSSWAGAGKPPSDALARHQSDKPRDQLGVWSCGCGLGVPCAFIVIYPVIPA